MYPRTQNDICGFEETLAKNLFEPRTVVFAGHFRQRWLSGWRKILYACTLHVS